MSLGCNDIGIRKSKFGAKTQFLLSIYVKMGYFKNLKGEHFLEQIYL